MNFILRIMVSGVLLVAAAGVSAQVDSDLLFRAMSDEIDRNMAKLMMEELSRPYFISYTIDDVQDVTLHASLGSVKRFDNERKRYLTVEVRVGSDTLDNTNFVAGFGSRGPHYSRIVIDDDYDALRNRIYLETDEAYKDALKALSKKKAFLQTRVIKDRPADFLNIPPQSFFDTPEAFTIPADSLAELVRRASAVLRDYPSIESSDLRLNRAVINQYFVNSKDARVLRGDRLIVVNLELAGRNKDGGDVSIADQLIVKRTAQLPPPEELAAWVRRKADVFQEIMAADEVEEYSGPVIFTGDAAGEFFRQLFARNIANAPSPTYGDERMRAMVDGPQLANKIRRRVLPPFFNVFDDPTMDKYGDAPLMGSYEVDDAGGQPQRIQLVGNGKLLTIPLGVAPTKKVTEPNGHARGAVSKSVTAKVSNLIVEPSERTSADSLFVAMQTLVEEFELEYGLVVTELTDLNAPRTGMRMFGGRVGGQSALTPPLEAYKVYAGGRREPVRNLEFVNVTVRSLRDILQADSEPHIYHYLIGNDYEMPASVVTPSFLVEELELKKTEAKIKKPPVLTSPLAEQ